MRSEIKELHQRLKTTTIYVTHDQIEALTMADKIVVMRDGRVEQVGSPLDLYDYPTNAFVAGFIGSPSMNFIKGAMTVDGFRSDEGILLPTGSQFTSAVTYGIRPEDIYLDPAGIEIKIVVLEPTGSETLVIAKLGDQTITCLLKERIRNLPGTMLRVSPKISAVHLFDSAGNRISD
jgi:multiple sugar transport system ATP-binding protein